MATRASSKKTEEVEPKEAPVSEYPPRPFKDAVTDEQAAKLREVGQFPGE